MSPGERGGVRAVVLHPRVSGGLRLQRGSALHHIARRTRGYLFEVPGGTNHRWLSSESSCPPWVQALGVALLPRGCSTCPGGGHGPRSPPAELIPAETRCWFGEEPEMLLLWAQSLLALTATAG